MKYSKPIDINALYSEFSLFDVLNFLLQTKLERKIYNELLQKVSKNFYDIHSIQSFVDFIKNKNNNITQDEYLTHLLDLLLEKSISHLESEIEPDDNLLVNQHFVFQNGHSLIPDCNVNLNYTPKLSPSSIKQINNNPYFYYVKNILNLRPLVFNEQNDLVRQNGILLHRILELFSHYCKNIQNIHDINEDMFIDFVLSRFANLSNNNISLHEKLTSFAPKIVKMEKNAKLHNFEILTEKLVSCVFNKHNLFAIADRIEIDNVNKTISIYDYKTGTLPLLSDEASGKYVQLSIIAYILLKDELYNNYSLEKLVYMNFNKINDQDLIISGEKLDIILKNTTSNLELFIQQYFNNMIKESLIFIPSSLNMLYEDVLQLEHFARKRRYFNVI